MNYVVNHKRFKKIFVRSELKKYLPKQNRIIEFPQYDKKYYNFFQLHAKEKYKLINNEELDKEVIVFLLKKIMNDKDLRTFSIKTIEKKYNEKKLDFFKELKVLLKKKNLLLEF